MKTAIKFSLAVGIMILIFAAGHSIAQTNNKGIIVSPKRVTFTGNDRVKEVIIANRGNTEARYRISVVNRKMKEDGGLEEAEEPAANENFADEYISFGPRRVTLGPKESQKVRVMSRLRNNSADGEYRSHLLIQEIPDAAPAATAATGQSEAELGIDVRAIFGITIPVILQRGDLEFSANLTNPRIRQSGNDTFLDISIERTGNKSVFGTVKVFTDDQEIGILKNVAVYLSTPRRNISVKLDPDYVENISGKDIRVTFSPEESNEDAPETELAFTAS